MKRYKIPIWENKEDYIKAAESIVSSLLALADREFQMRICNTFDRNTWINRAPQDWTEEHQYLFNHPYWNKITKEAQYALSLLKK